MQTAAWSPILSIPPFTSAELKVEPSFIHRLFFPQVPLVMAAQYGPRICAMPVVFYMSVSENPPMVAVDSRPESFTYKLALKSRAFSLSVFDRSNSRALSRLVTLDDASTQDMLSKVGLSHSGGKKLKVPCIDSAVATIECALSSEAGFGDHRMLVGSVEAAYASDAFKEFWDFTRYRPILYTGWREGLTTYSKS